MTTGRVTLDSVCPLDCPDTCSLAVSVEQGRVVRVDGSHRNPYTDGFICAKVRRYPERIYAPERVLHPLRRTGAKGAGQFARISWDEALDLVSERLRAAVHAWGAESILPYHYGGSNGMLNEEGADARFFHALGACELQKTICAAPTGAAARAMYGAMVGVPPQDYPHARCIVLWGVNPATTSIHTLRHVQHAKREGATIIAVDPLRTRTTRIADIHVRPRPGTDVVVALGVARHLLQTDAVAHDFIASHTEGFAAYCAAAEPYTPERVAAISGVDAVTLVRFAEAYANAHPAIIRCGWGVERNRNGGNAVRAILALPAITGKFGVRGGGYTMSMSRSFDVDARALARPDLRHGTPRQVNMTRLGRALTELDDPPIKVFFVYNANPLASTPDQNRILKGLARDDLFTVVHEQVLTDTALYADIVLPATTIFEQSELHKAYGHAFLQHSEPVIAPCGEAIANVELFRRLAERLELGESALWDESRMMVDAIGAARATQVRAEKIVRMRFGGSDEIVQFGTVFPRTADRKVHLAPGEFAAIAYREAVPSPYPLALLTPASERLVNSIFGEFNLDDPRLCLHPDDARARAIADDAFVRVFNALGTVEVRARLSDDVPPGVVTLPKGIWRRSTRNGSTATALIGDELTDLGDGACFNDARVEVARCED